MAKQSKKTMKISKKALFSVLIVVLLAVSLFFGVKAVVRYNAAADQAEIVQIRELILSAVQGLKKYAPVEARTGDIYFPEAKLYLPNPETALPFTYRYDKGDGTNFQTELSVSTYPVRGTTEMYSASGQESLFAAIPKLQACSRGIKLVYQPYPASDEYNELKNQVQLNNGQTLYIYIEKACPDLAETAELFKSIRSY